MFRISSCPSAARSLSLKFCAALLLAGSFLGLAAKPAQAQEPKASSATIYDYANTSQGNGYFNYGVIQAPDGNFYANGYQSTNILRVTPSGANTGTVGTLAGQLPSTCGSNVVANLILGPDGNLYGMTSQGGTGGNGVFFQYVIATRTCNPVYNFTTSTDGSGSAFRAWTLGSDGYLYGAYGSGCANNSGCIFRISTTGKMNIIYNFTDSTDGGAPPASIVEATDGNWYGTTNNGGSGANQGVFYKLVPGATFPWVETAEFNNSCSNGCYQLGPMNVGSDGNLDGTFTSGDIEGDGNIFQFDTEGDYTDLVDFGSSTPALYNSAGGVIIGGDLNMYGITQYGGANNTGGVWTSTNAGSFTKLADFSTNTAPALVYPQSPLFQATDGNFYGGTDYGGTKTLGGLFQVVVSPPVPAPISVSLSATTSSGSPVTVSWTVRNATGPSYRTCYLYEYDTANKIYTQTGGAFTGKATGTQSGSTLSGSTVVTPTATGTYTYSVGCAGTEIGVSPVLTVTGISSFQTKVVLTASSTAVTSGQSDTFTATVTRVGGSGFPSGKVSIGCCHLVFGVPTLNASGVATLTVSSKGEPIGTYPVVATYEGDSDDSSSTSAPLEVSLKNGTATTLSVTPSSVTIPADVTITIKVTQTTGTGTPTGTVNLIANGNDVILSNYPLTKGVASIKSSTGKYPAGTYSLTAKYNGSSTEATSTSTAVNETLTK